MIVCLGCGPHSPTDIAPVTGTVTMDGQPLPHASVLFITGSGRPAAGVTDAQGRYELFFTRGRPGAMIGTNFVRISTVRDADETADGRPIAGSDETVPARYNALTTLQFIVQPGQMNIANFDLDSSGPLPQELETAGEALPADAESAVDAEPGADATGQDP